MTHKDDDTQLDEVFAQMREGEIAPSDALLNKIMLDADAELATPVVHKPISKQGFGASFLDLIGGWPSFGGLAAATVAGVWIGVSPPDALSGVSAALWGETIEIPLFESDILAGLEG